MRNLHTTFIRATKKIINQRLKRTNSPDTRRPPHTIESPFNIPHPHRQDLSPALYILVKTTSQGILKKVSLPIRNEHDSIISPGDASGYLACSCKNPNDPTEHLNSARLIPADPSTIPTLTAEEHFVTSPLVFPNILIQDPNENNGTHILVKLPDHVKTVEDMTREDILEIVHQVLNNIGPTEVSDNIYTERFTDKALGIQPTAPPYDPSADDQSEHITPHRARLSTQWMKAYTEKRKHGTNRNMTKLRTQSDTELLENTSQDEGYEQPDYLQILAPLPIMMWAQQSNIAPAIDLAFQKWDPDIDVPTERIRPEDKAIIIMPDIPQAQILAVPTERERSKAIPELKQYHKTEEQAGRVRMGTLSHSALQIINTDILSKVPMAVYETAKRALQTKKSTETYTQQQSKHRPPDKSPSNETVSDRWDYYDVDNHTTKKVRKTRRHSNQSENGTTNYNSDSGKKKKTNTTATCPICKAIFADAISTLNHIQHQHQQPQHQANSKGEEYNKHPERPGKPTILKASQFQDSYIQISLADDDQAHFFTATAETMRDPRTNTVETRYLAPRFPESILALEETIAFRNVATKEFQKWYKAYHQIVTAKKMGSYRTYANHNIGLENSYTALMIAGQKDKLFTLKTNAPTLYPTKILELNEHLVTSFFHNQRVYCLESRIEWSSYYDICFSEKTIGREIFDRVQARLTSYPAVVETLKTISSFIEHIVLSLLPVQVPYAQRRTEILNIHISQLNSAVPSVDFTRQHIDQHGQELRFLHPAANAATPLTTDQEARLQDSIVDELLHEILAGTPFFGRLNQLYLPNAQYQDIRKVPKAKLLSDLARIIASDRATGTSTLITTHQTSTRVATNPREPARCTSCAALNVACSPNHCKLHQPTRTPSEVKILQRNLINPFKKKSDCKECQEEVIRKGMAELNPYHNKRTTSRNKSPKRNSSRSQSRNRRDNRKSRSRSRSKGTQGNTRKTGSNAKPQIRTILSRNTDDQGKQEKENKVENPTNYQTSSRQYKKPNDSTQEREWNYANRRYSPENRQNSQVRQPRWYSRSPSPRYGPNRQRSKSKSPRSPFNRRRSPYKHRSQSGYRSRSDTRKPSFMSRSPSRTRDSDNENTRRSRNESQNEAIKD